MVVSNQVLGVSKIAYTYLEGNVKLRVQNELSTLQSLFAGPENNRSGTIKITINQNGYE